LLNFVLSFASTYGEWGVAESTQWNSPACWRGTGALPTSQASASPTPRSGDRPRPGMTPRPSFSSAPVPPGSGQAGSGSYAQCWRYTESMHALTSCYYPFSFSGAPQYQYCNVIDSLGYAGGYNGSIRFRNRAATEASFACLQLASWLGFVFSVQAFVMHQQIRRKLSQLQRGPAARTACCVPADTVTLCGLKQAQVPAMQKPCCSDACEPIAGSAALPCAWLLQAQ
jgi:hypothetical protein